MKNLRYDGRMKPTPKPDEYIAFQSVLRRVSRFTRADMEAAEAAYRAERAQHPKRGPKPKTSASGRAACDKD